ncbi:MAG: spore coat protein YlbD [Bacilli bacterium]
MANREEFKSFIKTKPELVKYVQNGEMTWQKFYELYDLYGTNETVWSKYELDEDRGTAGVAESISKITNMVKSVDMNSIKSHINTAQKALDFVQDLTTKKASSAASTVSSLSKGPTSPRPLNKFFED